jgi:iron-sulfur cluster insertion protein
MITVTELAAAKIREIAVAENLQDQGIRVRVIGGGCSGFTHDLYFDDTVGELDEVFESLGVKLYIDPLSLQYLENVEIDFTDGIHGSGFKFNNPNSKGSCGCGSSVAF